MSKEKEAGTNEERVAFNLDDSAKEADEPNHDEYPEGDTAKVKFVNGGAADAIVDIDGKVHVEPKSQFVGLSKSELMAFEKDPYWVKVRWVLLVLFWIIWVGMLVAAIVIIVLAPKCPPRKDLKWWQQSTIYQVYPRSFKDSNGDGVGDIGGIHEKLDYLQKDLKTKAIYINPIYSSGGKDTGYDITNHTEIDPIFGDMANFASLVRAMHKRDMKIIMDFVPNHSSKDHPWFLKSKKGEKPYDKYYVWHPGKNTTTGGRRDVPNNWLSVFGGSAWEWDEDRQQYYLHQFASAQPDLDIRNPDVKEELKKIMLYWLENGVDGFRVDAVSHLFEGDLNQDEPVAEGKTYSTEDYKSLNHTLTTFQPETFELLTEWRALLDGLTKDDGKDRLLMVEAYTETPEQTLKLLNFNDKPGAHLSTNMALLSLKEDCRAECIQSLVNGFMDPFEGMEVWPNWQTGNHDVSRVVTRMGGQTLTNAVQMLLLTLPGTAFTYYGEEIGMHDVNVTGQEQDLAASPSRDPQRTPMQWTGADHAALPLATLPGCLFLQITKSLMLRLSLPMELA
jgi:glycosidase